MMNGIARRETNATMRRLAYSRPVAQKLLYPEDG